PRRARRSAGARRPRTRTPRRALDAAQGRSAGHLSRAGSSSRARGARPGAGRRRRGRAKLGPEMPLQYITIKGAREHNLKNVNLEIPRDRMVVITGLSGSGKSSLAFDTIYAEGQRRYVESLSAYARQFLGQMEK